MWQKGLLTCFIEDLGIPLIPACPAFLLAHFPDISLWRTLLSATHKTDESTQCEESTGRKFAPTGRGLCATRVLIAAQMNFARHRKRRTSVFAHRKDIGSLCETTGCICVFQRTHVSFQRTSTKEGNPRPAAKAWGKERRVGYLRSPFEKPQGCPQNDLLM